MGLLSSLLEKPAKRLGPGSAFPAANISRLTASWTDDPGAVNRWLRWELRTLRARSRSLARGDAYAAKFLKSVVDNVGGPQPFELEARIGKPRGAPDEAAIANIEEAWKQWTRIGQCEITGKFSLSAVHRLLLRNLARDGEILVRKVRGSGDYGLRLQVLDIERLDELRNEERADGSAIKMGVELSPYGQPLAYWILRRHPGEVGTWGGGGERVAERIPADQIMHIFVPEWPEQARGIPWMHAAMMRLWNLGGFEEAAVINARMGATKMAVLYSPDGTPPVNIMTGKDTAGNMLTDSEPGQYWTLPDGYRMESFNPEYPTAAVEPFIRACLRGGAAAVGMSYHSLANDPSVVNYSTARMALLEERDAWMSMQEFWKEHFCEPLYAEWLAMSRLIGRIPATYIGDRFMSVYFQAKRWKWIDPQKEVAADVESLNAGLTSRTRIAAEDGEDIEDIFNEIADENALASSLGITLPTPSAPAAAASQPSDQQSMDQQTADQTAATGKAMEGVLHAFADDFVKATSAVTAQAISAPRETKVNIGETVVHVHTEGPKGPTVKTVVAERRADGKLIAEITESEGI